MTNSQFKKAAKEIGIRVYHLLKNKRGYYMEYAYKIDKNTISTTHYKDTNSHNLQEIFNHNFAK